MNFTQTTTCPKVVRLNSRNNQRGAAGVAIALPFVTVRVDGIQRVGVTDPYGHFTITQVPVGPVHLIADGSTTTAVGEWPTLSQNIITVAGADNPLPAPIYMIKLDISNAVTVGGVDVDYTLAEVPGFKLSVKAGSVTFPDGSKTGQLSVTAVNASKVPMSPPNGMQPQLIVTIQPTGAVFDPPAPLTLPNVDAMLRVLRLRCTLLTTIWRSLSPLVWVQ